MEPEKPIWARVAVEGPRMQGMPEPEPGLVATLCSRASTGLDWLH